jgi:5-carboxymethyl-2-hydroxymuconate isomerase
MPHITVEYSVNIEEKLDIDRFLEAMHAAVQGVGLSEIAGLRTRAEPRQHYRIADNDPANAFIAILVRIAQGRSPETHRKLLDTVCAAANKHLEAVLATTPLALSVEIQEINPTMRVNQNNIRDWMKTRENAA